MARIIKTDKGKWIINGELFQFQKVFTKKEIGSARFNIEWTFYEEANYELLKIKENDYDRFNKLRLIGDDVWLENGFKYYRRTWATDAVFEPDGLIE